jgi:hypothetical protein
MTRQQLRNDRSVFSEFADPLWAAPDISERPIIRALRILLLFLLPVLRTAAAVELPRTSSDIEIDGVLDEEAWDKALRVELTSP